MAQSATLAAASPSPCAPLWTPHRYNKIFAEYDSLAEGSLSREAMLSLFNAVQLPGDLLDRLWPLADVDCDGKLSRSEFRVAMHLATLAYNGVALPLQLPPELLAEANSEQSPHVWVLDEQDAQRYDGFFAACDTFGRGALSRDEVLPLFERANLPSGMLNQLWPLADVDADGVLSRAEFRAAMHLAMLTHNGVSLPHSMPAQLMRSAGISAVVPPVHMSVPIPEPMMQPMMQPMMPPAPMQIPTPTPVLAPAQAPAYVPPLAPPSDELFSGGGFDVPAQGATMDPPPPPTHPTLPWALPSTSVGRA